MDNKELAKQTLEQIRWWHIAAWTLPLGGLGGLFFLEMFGWTNFYTQTLTVGAIVFFIIGVYWWFWALYKIANIAKALFLTTEKLDGVKQALQDIKNDLGNRKR